MVFDTFTQPSVRLSKGLFTMKLKIQNNSFYKDNLGLLELSSLGVSMSEG